MRVSDVIEELRSKLSGDVVHDPALHAKVVATYSDWIEAIDARARVIVRVTPPSSPDVARSLRRLDELVRARFGHGLPESFVELHLEHGRVAVEVRHDGEVLGAAMSTPDEILGAHWIRHPAWTETSPHGSTREHWHPVVPFLRAEGDSFEYAFLYRCDPACALPCLGRADPDELIRADAGLVYRGSTARCDFTEWLARWINGGFDPTGVVY